MSVGGFSAVSRRRWLVGTGAWAAGFVPIGSQPAVAEIAPTPRPSRMALAIGNAAYAGARLKNPINDARLIAQTLASLGFDTEMVTDVTRAQTLDIVRAWLSRSQRADVRLLYFAGHGAQYRGRSYLIPVDAELRSEDDLPGAAIEAEALADSLSRVPVGINVLVLDACRNVPTIRPSPGTRLRDKPARAPAPGLAPLTPPRGTLVAYAASPGAYAKDDPRATNGLYARFLARHLQTPGVAVEEVFKRTRADVMHASEGTQVPWESSSVVGDLCLIGPCSRGALPTPDLPRVTGGRS